MQTSSILTKAVLNEESYLPHNIPIFENKQKLAGCIKTIIQIALLLPNII